MVAPSEVDDLLEVTFDTTVDPCEYIFAVTDILKEGPYTMVGELHGAHRGE